MRTPPTIKSVTVGIGVLACILTVGLAGISLYAKTDHCREYLLNRFNAAVAGSISMSDHEIRFTQGRIALENVTVSGAAGERLATSPQITAEIAYLPLLKGLVLLQRLHIDQPDIQIRRQRDSTIDLLAALRGVRQDSRSASHDEAGSTMAFAAEDISVRDGHFRLTVESLQTVLAFRHFTLAAQADLKQKTGRLNLKAPETVLHAGGRRLTIQPMQLSLALPHADSASVHLAARTSGAALDLNGTVERPLRNPRLRLQMDLRVGSSGSRIHGSLDLKNIFAGEAARRDVHLDAVTYDLSARLKNIETHELPPAFRLFEGRLNADLQIEGKGIHFDRMTASTRINCQVERFRTTGLQQAVDLAIDAAGDMQAGVIAIRDMTVTGRGVNLTADGFVDPSAGSVQADVGITADDVHPITTLFGGPDIAGSAALTAKVSGHWQRPRIDLTLDADQVRSKGIHYGRLEMTGGLDDQGLLQIDSLRLANQETRARGKAAIQLFKSGFELDPHASVKAQVQFSGAEPGHFAASHPLTGVFQGRLEIDGTLQSLRASAELQGADVALRDVELGDFDAAVHFQDGGLKLDSLRVAQDAARGRASGVVRIFADNTWRLLPEPIVDVDLHATGLALENYHQNASGQVRLDAHVTGPPSNLTGTGSLAGDHLTIMAQPVQSLDLAFEINDQGIEVQWAQAEIDPSNRITATGWIGFDRRYQLDLRAEALQIEAIEKVRSLGAVQGQMDLHLHGEGRLERPVLEAELQLRKLVVNSQPVPDATFGLKLKDDRLHVKGRQSFDLRADYDLSQKKYDLEIRFVDTDLAPFFLIAGQPDVGGTASGTFTARGNTTALVKSSAMLELTSFSLIYRGETLAQTEKLEARLDNRTLMVADTRLHILESGYVNLTGSGTIEGDFSIFLEGDIAARAAAIFFKELADIQGSVSLKAKVSGSWPQPDLQGEIVWEDVGFRIPRIDMTFEGLDAAIRLSSSRIEVDKLQGAVGGGTFQLGGQVRIEQWRPGEFDLKLAGQAIPVLIPDTLEAAVNLDLTVSGRPEDPSVEGRLILLEGLYFKDVNLIRSLAEPNPIAAPQPVSRRDTLLNRVRTRIQVTYRDPFVVENNIAYLEIHPDLVLSGPLVDPVITGTARVHEGSLSYYNQTFEVEKGIVNFVSPYETRPEIDIVGVSRVRDWRIRLSLAGNPDKLLISLSSEPEEADADILSLLAFGKTTRELSGDESGLTDSPEAMMAQLMASSFGEDIKQATGLDYLEVASTPDASADSAGVDVTIGKNLSDRMTVKYTVGSGKGDYRQRAAAEYKLIENILLSGFQDTKGNYGGEVIFRIEFRLLR